MKAFRFSQLSDGTYSVKVYGERGTVSSETVIPENHNGKPVSEVTFGKMLDANFRSLHIPASVRRIDHANSEHSIFAADIAVDDNNPCFRSDGKALYSKDGKILYRLFPRYIDEYTVKNGTEKLDEKAFADHVNLKKVTLPDGLREIGKQCFSRCSEIKELIIPDSVAVLGENPFGYMNALKTLKLPENISELGDDILFALDLPELYIPGSVERISGSMITAVGTFIGKYTVPQENRFFRSEDGVIYNKEMTVLVKAPSSVPASFKVPASVVRIADRAFLSCTELREVILPEGMEHIGTQAFYGCPLLNVTIPKTVSSIGKGAFDPQRSTTVYDTLKADPEFLFPSFGDPLEKELIIINSETGKIKGKIWAHIGSRRTALLELYRSCLDEKWNFDYRRFDIAFDTKSVSPFIKACYAAYRLKNPPEPSACAKEKFRACLRKSGAEILRENIDRRNFGEFARLSGYMLTEDNIIKLTDYAAKKNAVEFTAFLLDYRDKNFGALGDALEL